MLFKKLLMKVKNFDYKLIITVGLVSYNHYYGIFKNNKKK